MRRIVAAAAAALAPLLVAGLITGPVSASPSPQAAPSAQVTQGRWAGTVSYVGSPDIVSKAFFTVKGSTIVDFLVDGVNTSCGFKTISLPSARILSRGRVNEGFVPVPGLDDIITLRGRFANRVFTGIVREGPLCSVAVRVRLTPA